MLARVGAESASEDPEQLVPEAKPSMPSTSSRTGEHCELIASKQVFEHQIPVWARRSSQGCEQEPEKFEHTVSIADLHLLEVLSLHSPPHNYVEQTPQRLEA